MTSLDSPQQTAWSHLQAVSRKWFYQPDFGALRVCLATAKGLDTETTPIWTMLVGPSSCGKTEFYGLAAAAYSPSTTSDDISLPGLMTMKQQGRGKGVLQRIGSRGLWLVSDYSTVLALPDDKRNAVNAACRRIYDGGYSRDADGDHEVWRGHINMLACCTNAIEKYTKHTADLGERFIQVRISKAQMTDDYIRCVERQRTHRDEYRQDIIQATRSFLRPGVKVSGVLPFDLQRLIMRWAEFVTICRVQVERNWKEEIVHINQEEGAGRIGAQFLGLACADAALFGHPIVTPDSLNVIQRVAYDCIPLGRAAILRRMVPNIPIRRVDLWDMSGLTHPVTFDKALDELTSIGVLKCDTTIGATHYSLTERPQNLLLETLKVLEPVGEENAKVEAKS